MLKSVNDLDRMWEEIADLTQWKTADTFKRLEKQAYNLASVFGICIVIMNYNKQMSNIRSLCINVMSLQYQKGFWSTVLMQRELVLMAKKIHPSCISLVGELGKKWVRLRDTVFSPYFKARTWNKSLSTWSAAVSVTVHNPQLHSALQSAKSLNKHI